jgi:electron transfer flavoprotein alpha subunit
MQRNNLWSIPSNNLPVPYEPVSVHLQPQQGVPAMRDTENVKRVFIKYVGSTKPGETVLISPGTTTRDLLNKLGLAAGYQVLDARNDIDYQPDDVLFARVADGDLVHVSAMVDAGR